MKDGCDMKIFANQALEISDNQEPTANSRYSDNSTKYEQGFKFGTPLNSATINGFLHSATSELEKILHVKLDASHVRYNTKEEIEDIAYHDKHNYVLKSDIDSFLTNRIFNKLTRFSNVVFKNEMGINDKGIAKKSIANSEKALYCNGDLPVRFFAPKRHVDAINVFPNSLTLLSDKEGDKIGGDYLDCTINGQGEFAIAIPVGKCNPKKKKVRVKFTSNLTYRDKTLYAGTYYKAFKRVRVFISGNKLLICEGLKGISSTSNEAPEYILEHTYSEE